MKIFTLILILIALGLIGYNASLVDYSNPLQGDSTVAIIGILSALCAVLLLVIFSLSRKINDKLKNR